MERELLSATARQWARSCHSLTVVLQLVGVSEETHRDFSFQEGYLDFCRLRKQRPMLFQMLLYQ